MVRYYNVLRNVVPVDTGLCHSVEVRDVSLY